VPITNLQEYIALKDLIKDKDFESKYKVKIEQIEDLIALNEQMKLEERKSSKVNIAPLKKETKKVMAPRWGFKLFPG
jgi:hypothetical protein